ncbi:MAG: NAD-dependent aldehyde dehydrogenase, partial [Myxococcota bacterium]
MSVFPPSLAGVPATSRPELDRALERLQRHKERWREVSLGDRIRLLREVERRLVLHGRSWAAACAIDAGYRPEENGAGEAFLASAVVTLRALRQYREALACEGQPKLKTKVRSNGQVTARVLPVSVADALLFPRVTADVWLEPGADPTKGRIYREGHPDPGRVALVLGAGNIPSIAPTDALHKLLVEDQVVLLKMNPVNEYCGPFL